MKESTPPVHYYRLKSKRTLNYWAKLSWALSAVYLLACGAGYIQFTLWRQVGKVMGPDIIGWLGLQHLYEMKLDPFFLRRLVVLPALLVAEISGLSPDRVFSLFAGACIVTTALCVNQAHLFICGPRGAKLDSVVLAGFIIPSLFMNGRMCLGLCGMAILLCLHVGWLRGQVSTGKVILFSGVGLAMTSVSSGCFMVGFSVTLLWVLTCVLELRKTRRVINRLMALAGVLVLCAIGVLESLVLIKKELGYFSEKGDVFTGLLGHGPAELLTAVDETFVYLTLLWLFLFSYTFLLFWLAQRRCWPLCTYLAPACILGGCWGLLGYSAMVSNLPIAALLLKLLIVRPRGTPADRERLQVLRTY